MLYIRDSLKPEPMSALNNMSKIQVFWTKITLPFQNVKILFSTIYRPPDSKVEYFNPIVDNIESASILGYDMVITGDLNINCMPYKCNDSNNIVKITKLFALTQLIDRPTRVTLESSTLIDGFSYLHA